MPVLVNFLLFQAGWFLCVWGGAQHLPWLGVGATAMIVCLHAYAAPRPGVELALVAGVAVLGLAWDSALVAAGLFVYPSGNVLAATAPVWIVAIWALFATTLNVSLRWLKTRLWLAALLGAGGGPAAYYAGAQLGGVALGNVPVALLAQAAGWTFIMPLLVAMSNRLDGMRPFGREEAGRCLI